MLFAGAVLAATALVASLVSAAVAGPNVLRVHVIEHATTDTPVDLTTNGDLLTFHNEIFDENNQTVVGSDQGECVRIEVGVSWECRWVTTLEVGSITVEGPFFDAANSALAVTGGTGPVPWGARQHAPGGPWGPLGQRVRLHLPSPDRLRVGPAPEAGLWPERQPEGKERSGRAEHAARPLAFPIGTEQTRACSVTGPGRGEPARGVAAAGGLTSAHRGPAT